MIGKNISGMLGVLLLVGSWLSAEVQDHPRGFQLLPRVAQLREAPDRGSRILATLGQGTKVVVGPERSGWLGVKAGTLSGFMTVGDLAPAAPAHGRSGPGKLS